MIAMLLVVLVEMVEVMVEERKVLEVMVVMVLLQVLVAASVQGKAGRSVPRYQSWDATISLRLKSGIQLLPPRCLSHAAKDSSVENTAW